MTRIRVRPHLASLSLAVLLAACTDRTTETKVLYHKSSAPPTGVFSACGRVPYPKLAIQQLWEGTTRMQVQVSPTGEITRINILKSSGYPILDDASVHTLHHCQAQATIQNGIPVSAWHVLDIRWRLSDLAEWNKLKTTP